jgi:NADPH-dependent 2,4-dienoyl-CoA reductase/sulfur reductase-like enzyme
MADRRADVVVVGAGLAGLAAADALGGRGLGVLVLDDNRRPGGQYLRGGRGAGRSWLDRVAHRGLKLAERIPGSGVEVASRAEVLGIEPGFRLLVADENGEITTICCDRLLLATGARERFVPFKGWTLPGVISTGAVQILIKQSGVLPAGETVVAGAGPFLSAVARDIQKSGGRVPAVLDEMRFSGRVPAPALVAGHFAKFARGAAMLARLRLAGAAVRGGVRILEARGGDGPLEVVAARVDHAGIAIPGSETAYSADCLATGFGFSANVELAQLAGCSLAFNPGLGGWVVKVNEDLETSIEGIHAAGEITAVGGAAKSLAEGRLAGLSILRRMGLLKSDRLGGDISALKKTRRRQLAFARYFNAQCGAAPGYMAAWIRGLADDVPVCRCEDVGLGDIRRAVGEGFDTPAAVKKATRCGMGICQGSTCKSILLDALAALTGKQPAHIPLPSVRIPIKPVPLGGLAGEGHYSPL